MSDKMHQLILRVKDILQAQHNEAQDCIRSIQNEIDQKNIEIKEIISQNLQDIIEHNIKYQQTIYHQRKLESQCEQFTKKIQKTQKLSQYDENLIQKSQKMLLNIDKVKGNLEHHRDYVKLIRKVAININEERYNNAIKIMNQLKQILCKNNNTPLIKVLKILRNKIIDHLIKLTDSFWDNTIGKQQQIGALCFNKVLINQHSKSNIYQNFFSRNTRTSNLGLRQSFIQAPMRFLKKISEDSQILQKYTVRINVEMAALKQVKILCNELKEDELFKQLLTNHMRKTIKKIADENYCQNQHEFQKLLSRFIGFLLVKREVIAYFDLKSDEKLFISQIYSVIGNQLKQLTKNNKQISPLQLSKQSFDIFYTVLTILNIDTNSLHYTIILGELFKQYCNISLEFYESKIVDAMNKDNYSPYQTDDPLELKKIDEILNTNSQNYIFTSIVTVLVDIFYQLYDGMLTFVKDSDLNKSQLHGYLGQLLQRFIVIYGGQLINKDHPLQIAQGQINLRYSQQILKYFSNQLQFEYARVTEWTYPDQLEKVIVQTRRRIRQLIEQKIDILMSSYQMSDIWLANDVQQYSNDFVGWMMQYINEIISCMRKSQNPFHQQTAYSAIGYICFLYWQQLKECKQFNLITIYNLDLDLINIYKYCSINLSMYPNLMDKFKSLREFYSFLLTNNINDILDSQKKQISYPSLDFTTTIPILKKYNKAKHNANGKIRQLKKKDLDVVIKKMEILMK